MILLNRYLAECCVEYWYQLEKLYSITPENMTACNMCTIAYDCIVRGDY